MSYYLTKQNNWYPITEIEEVEYPRTPNALKLEANSMFLDKKIFMDYDTVSFSGEGKKGHNMFLWREKKIVANRRSKNVLIMNQSGCFPPGVFSLPTIFHSGNPLRMGSRNNKARTSPVRPISLCQLCSFPRKPFWY